ncbi:MAG: rhodanese-like domain-containing protein [Thermoanaerobaculia bacterium]
MRHLPIVLAAVLAVSPALADEPLPNPAIDMKAHIRLTEEAAKLREKRRLTEEDFLRMSREPGTVVLDARSARMYGLLHVKGAVNLSYPDFTAEALARVIPSKDAPVLIYCNNNFLNAAAFPMKVAMASLNLSTFATLYMYGYKNVYELGPLVAIEKSKLEFEPAR